MGIKKFIQTAGDFFTGSDDKWERHSDIADNNNVSHGDVTGGGFIDTDRKLIFGKSEQFGEYDADALRKLLGDDWEID